MTGELDRARKREAATREILDLISLSRDDAMPVFNAILHRVAALCGAHAAVLIMGKAGDTHQRMAAQYGVDPATIARYDRGEVSMNPDASFAAQAIVTGKVVHVEDMMDTEFYRQGVGLFVSIVRHSGVRTEMFVPILVPGGAIGCFTIFRKEVRPYSADEIALAETFAAQAVIAIENVRQFRELQTRLAREAATREILEVISQSRDDEKPVFDAILRRAAHLCDAYAAALILAKPGDTHQRMAASYGVDAATIAIYDRGEVSMDPDASSAARAIASGKVVHVEDQMDTEFYRQGVGLFVSIVRDSGIRTEMLVPLLTPAAAIGTFVIFRREVRPFTRDEIALAETFAAQAVIAIENVRQFRELQTRLEREKASAEILEVISQSRDDDRPVFDVVLRKAAELCHASMASLDIISEDRSHAVLVAHWGEAIAELIPVGTTVWPMDSDLAPPTCMREGRIVHIHDMADTDLYRSGDPTRVAAVDKEGIRTFLAVPLFSGGRTVGCIEVYRPEVNPFDDADIALVETFAAQAVIAIENVRQFRELQTRLAREAATREILEVISHSRDDDKPVFDVVLRKAADLCHASLADLSIVSEDRSHAVMVAVWGEMPRHYAVGAVWPMESDLAAAICMREGRVMHVHDLADTDLYRSGDPIRVTVVDVEGMRTFLTVPLLSGGRAVGCIAVYRREVNPFKADEIALAETFAAQAVIAIENVRQFRELQARLAREKASAEILEVISQSRDDERPVFEVVLRKSADLCHASMADLSIISDDRSHAVLVQEWGEGLRHPVVTIWPLEADFAPSTCMREGRIVHVHDLADTDLYRSGDPVRVNSVDNEGIRTYLAVPLFSGGLTVGCIAVYRREIRPFKADEIALVETFAAQAVIAIENVRQFKALEALNAELGDRVQDQVGEIERMGRLKRFLPSAVANAVVTSGSEKLLSSHRALLSVLFCDIRGFTAFCETAEPEETIEVLQTYHEEMGKLINAHGAGVDHRMGDGIMVLFNDPLPCDDPAGEAVRLAIAMRTRMAELGQLWKRLGHRLGFGVGISLGYATVGMVGFEGRFDYTASGSTINLASRLCDEALDGEILLSPRASIAVEDRFQVESRGEITLKGIREPVEVFRLTYVGAA